MQSYLRKRDTTVRHDNSDLDAELSSERRRGTTAYQDTIDPLNKGTTVCHDNIDLNAELSSEERYYCISGHH